jgi:hypothetical protein
VKADRNGNLFVADTVNEVIRWVTPSGQMITFAGLPWTQRIGSPSPGFFGDGGPATAAIFDYPDSIDQDSYGNFYVSDEGNDRIREISAFAGYGLSVSGLAFDAQKAGTASAIKTVVVSAIGPTTIRGITVSHPFKETDNCAHAQLSAGQTCQIQVTFDPAFSGSFAGSLRIYSDAFFVTDEFADPIEVGNPDKVTLSGTAP